MMLVDKMEAQDKQSLNLRLFAFALEPAANSAPPQRKETRGYGGLFHRSFFEETSCQTFNWLRCLTAYVTAFRYSTYLRTYLVFEQKPLITRHTGKEIICNGNNNCVSRTVQVDQSIKGTTKLQPPCIHGQRRTSSISKYK
jgi:hypothetical protein